MSWGAYIAHMETSKARISYAGIFGKQGGLWAESENKESTFPITEAEILHAARCIANQDMGVMGSGLTAGGSRFTCILIDTDVLVCQGKDAGKKDQSLVFALSDRAVIVGFNAEPDIKCPMVRGIVEGMKDHLKKSCY